MVAAMIIGCAFFTFGCIGILEIYTRGIKSPERTIIIIAAFVIGGVLMIIGSEDPEKTAQRLEQKRWEIAHCYGPSHQTENCVPSMRDGLPITE